MTLQDQANEASSPALQQRTGMAMATAAQNISTEAEDTPNHANRISLATQIARSPTMYIPSFTTMLAAQNITSDSSDQEVSDMVSAVWNTVAGVPPMAVNP